MVAAESGEECVELHGLEEERGVAVPETLLGELPSVLDEIEIEEKC